MSAIYDNVVAALTEHLGVDPVRISLDATLEDLELDSLALLELAVVLQDEAGIKFEDFGISRISIGPRR